MSYLVCGGGGFIGSNIVEALLADGNRVRVLDDFTTGRRQNLERTGEWASAAGGSFELIEGDIRDEDACRKAVDGMSYVIHLAAIPSVPRSVAEPVLTSSVNLDGALKMLVAARDAGAKRFVFSSSSSIYGESEELPKVETMAPAPISPYGLQKLGAETYCALFHRLYDMPTVALRYFNVFGPRQDPHSEYAAVIPKFLRAVRDGQRPTIHGDGEQTRDFTYVANVVRANRLACEAGESALGRAFNIGCGERISLNELVSRIGEIADRQVEPIHGPERAGDIKHSLAAIDEARTHLSFEPREDLMFGLDRTMEAL